MAGDVEALKGSVKADQDMIGKRALLRPPAEGREGAKTRNGVGPQIQAVSHSLARRGWGFAAMTARAVMAQRTVARTSISLSMPESTEKSLL